MTDAPFPSLASERFQLTAFLAKGGMATVYRAWDHDDDEWCAVKVLDADSGGEERARRRFLAEGRTLLQLSHRNIIHARHLSDDPSFPFLAMEIADAGSLEDHVQQHGPLPPRMAVDVAIQIGKGVAASHKWGVIHRDIKPQNILVNRMGICKLSDFGIAKLLDTHSLDNGTVEGVAQTPTAMGTLGYMAPEQRSDPAHVDVRADVYGLGASLFALVAGRNVHNLFLADRDAALLDPVPEPLRPAVQRATAYRPEERFASAQDFIEALFELRDVLEPIPSNTARLASAAHREPPPPVPLSLHKPSLPTPSTESTAQTVSGTTPRDHSTEVKPSSKSPIGIIVIALLACVALPISSLAYVRAAHDEANVAQARHAQVLQEEIAVIDELSALGASNARLSAIIHELSAADNTADAWRHANRLIAALSQAELAYAQPQMNRVRTASVAMSRIERIRTSHGEWVAAVGVWQRRMESPFGWFAMKTGWVDEPPMGSGPVPLRPASQTPP